MSRFKIRDMANSSEGKVMALRIRGVKIQDTRYGLLIRGQSSRMLCACMHVHWKRDRIKSNTQNIIEAVIDVHGVVKGTTSRKCIPQSNLQLSSFIPSAVAN
mmetsp:Transcript_10956/g.20262  ORF Transcript_10956/g.20262 Transcript_10956/m.20262 type:complete len:102 (-) Transcript_10956:517-822(-)